jgi:hypothetical protein
MRVDSLEPGRLDLTPTSGQGNGSFTFRAGVNPAPSRREGDIVVNDSRVRVSQAASACVFDLAPTSHSVAASRAGGTIAVTVAAGCAWIATLARRCQRASAGHISRPQSTMGADRDLRLLVRQRIAS